MGSGLGPPAGAHGPPEAQAGERRALHAQGAAPAVAPREECGALDVLLLAGIPRVFFLGGGNSSLFRMVSFFLGGGNSSDWLLFFFGFLLVVWGFRATFPLRKLQKWATSAILVFLEAPKSVTMSRDFLLQEFLRFFGFVFF